ncbi:MAG: enoyl-CoA hydratase/isomerase family protein [Planctomycetota bacterium]|jgi:enoyl-CoA hydratase/carnithine racemase
MSTSPAGDDPVTVREEQVERRILRWVLCNDARRNAIDPGALAWIARRASELDQEVVVLTGAGNEAFCAGFDLTALGNADTRRAADPPDAALIAATAAMTRANATFVAALQGYAIGAGVELACSCDLRVAREGIYFAVPVGRLGVVYHATGLARMRSVFGDSLVKRLVLLGERIDAAEAHAAGALARLVAPESLAEAALEVAGRIRDAAPLGVRAHRNLLRHLAAGEMSPETLDEHERARTQAYASADHEEGRAALREGRPPRFVGR